MLGWVGQEGRFDSLPAVEENFDETCDNDQAQQAHEHNAGMVSERFRKAFSALTCTCMPAASHRTNLKQTLCILSPKDQAFVMKDRSDGTRRAFGAELNSR